MATNKIHYYESPIWRVKPTEMQARVLSLHYVKDLLFGGAAGPGKSESLLQLSTQFVDHPGWHTLLLRHTYAELSQSSGLMDRAIKYWAKEYHWNGAEHKFTWPSGSTLTFGHLSDRNAHYRYDGAEYTFIGIDEARSVPEEQLRYLQTRLRSTVDNDLPRMYRLASNPGGISHDYLYNNYVTVPGKFVAANRKDNPYLPDDYDKQFDMVDEWTRLQLLHGDWTAAARTDYFPDNYQIQYAVFEHPRRVRSWDLASTDRATADYTVGMLISYENGRYNVDGIERGQWNPADVTDKIIRTAHKDGRDVKVLVEEPYGVGSIIISDLARQLPGYDLEGIKPHGDKAERARPVAGALRNGLLAVKDWPELVMEMKGFPVGAHDDQVDALSQAINWIADDNNVALNRILSGRNLWV